MYTATCFDPGATEPKRYENGQIIEHTRPTERRAFLSAIRAWWPTRRPDSLKMALRKPPIGARIYLDGAPYAEWREVEVIDPDTDEVVDIVEQWVDVRSELALASKAEKLKAANARRRAERIAKGRKVLPAEPPAE